MPDFETLFPKRFLSAEDIPSDGLEVTITVLKPEQIETQDKGTQEKGVLYFAKLDKGLLLNKTNAVTIASLYGRDYARWAGQKIVLVVDDAVLFKGRLTRGIRVRKPSSV